MKRSSVFAVSALALAVSASPVNAGIQYTLSVPGVGTVTNEFTETGQNSEQLSFVLNSITNVSDIYNGSLTWQGVEGYHDDLDLYLVTPEGTVSFRTEELVFSEGGRAVLSSGDVIDQDGTSVESIELSGSVPAGTYSYYANAFSLPSVEAENEQEEIALVTEEAIESISGDNAVITTSRASRNTSRRVGVFLGSMNSAPSKGSDSQSGMSAGEFNSRDSVWASPNYTSFGSRNGRSYDGKSYSISAGYDRLISDDAVIGVSIILEKSDSDFTDNTGSVDSDNISAIFYAGKALDHGIILDGFIGYGYTENNVKDTTDTTKYDSNKWMVGATLSKLFESKNIDMSALTKLSLVHANDDIDSYNINSSNVASKNQVFTQGRLEIELIKQMGKAAPYFIAGFERDFENGSAHADANDTGGLLGGGVRYTYSDNMTMGIDYITEIGRGNERMSSLSAELRYTF